MKMMNWLIVAAIVVAVWWFFFRKGQKSFYVNSVCQAAEIGTEAEPVNAIPTMLPSVAGVAMGTSSYRAKTCGSCGM